LLGFEPYAAENIIWSLEPTTADESGLKEFGHCLLREAK